MSKATIADLNDDCLREIFYYLPLAQMVRLREVCTVWRDISDDCWSGPEHVNVTYAFSNKERLTINRQAITVTIASPRLLEIIFKRFGDGIISLLDRRKFRYYKNAPDNFLLSLGIEHCPNVRRFETYIRTREDVRNLVQFGVDKHLELLRLRFGLESSHVDFSKIPTERLETIDFTTQQDYVHESGFIDETHIIDRALGVHYASQKLFGIISKKNTLWRLELWFEHCYIKSETMEPERPQQLTPILQLTNLRELYLRAAGLTDHSKRVTDEFLIGVSTQLQLLEILDIDGPVGVTEKGINSLASLRHLKKLKISRCPIMARKLHLFYGLEDLNLRNCGVTNTQAISLLEKAKIMTVLNLAFCSIGNETLVAAVEIVKKRTNGIPLTLVLPHITAHPEVLTETVPQLNIIYK